MQAERLTAAKLAEVINVQPSTVSHIIAGRNNPRYDFLAAILKNFPKVNSRWLMLGEGDMYEEVLEKREPELELTPAVEKTVESIKQSKMLQGDDNSHVINELPRRNDVQKEESMQPPVLVEVEKEVIEQSPVHIDMKKEEFMQPPVQMELKTEERHMEVKEAAKIVIFNTDGTFEIYQN